MKVVGPTAKRRTSRDKLAGGVGDEHPIACVVVVVVVGW